MHHSFLKFTRKSRARAERLEAENRATANVVIVLPGMAGVHVERRLACPEVASFRTKAKRVDSRNLHIQPDPALERSICVHTMSGVLPVEDQVLAGHIMRQPAPEAEPWREGKILHQIKARSWCNENRTVLAGNLVLPVVEIFVRVIDHRHFRRQSAPVVGPQPSRVVALIRKALAKV